MTRQQQISDAVQMCDITANRHDLDCFVVGAECVDAHPNWHKYPDDKPSSTNSYLVYLDYGINCPIRDVYDYDEDRKEFGYLTKGISGQVVWKPIDGCVKAWMELPEEPKFD